MPSVHVKSEWSQDSRGQTIETQTWESFDAMPAAPGGARNIRKTHTDGKFTLVCDLGAKENQGDEYSVEGSMSQEPIETHEKFKDITEEDWKKWNLWKNNPADPALAGWKPADQSGVIADLANPTSRTGGFGWSRSRYFAISTPKGRHYSGEGFRRSWWE